MQGGPLYPTSGVSALVGCEDAERELVSRLLDSTEENLSVISLVSEEAVGKTALARHVYKRLDIRQHFQCRLWVHVRKEFAYKDLLHIILKQIPICLLKDIELKSEEELRQLVFQTLMKFRFLMVLDDVCTEDMWFKLLRPFADATNGSRVILTTRHFNVASEADPWSCPLNLSHLTEEESWVLFLKNVGSHRSPENSSDLNNFREEILGICQGLPPAILLLGGLLSTIELCDWSRVIDRSQFGEDESALLNIVALMSYNGLPSALKPCFLYLALFPKAYEIPKRRLLQLWLAEGFVQLSPDEASVPIEDKAKIYLEELVSRNMIEIATRKSDGSPKTCRMPCFLYGFFLPKAEEEGFLHVHHCRPECTCANSEIIKVQRLADQFAVSKSHMGNLCAYISFKAEKQGTSNSEIGTLLKKIIKGRDRVLLKVLDLEGVYKPQLPKKLGELRNLKYLGLRWTGLDSCPASIGDLPCLETLDLKYTSITTLPSSIWKAKKLRHLYMNEVSIQKPSRVVSSTNQLQTLMGLFIGSKDPKDCGLEKFTSLRKLELTCHSESTAETAKCISQLGSLLNLRLRSRNPFGQPSDLVLSPMKDHQSLSKLYLFGVVADHDVGYLPQNLKILTLSMSKLKKDPMPALGKLRQLNILRLFSDSYLGSEMTCHRGDFPKLSVLKVWNLKELKQWTVEKEAMPQLLELEIRRCENLESSDGLEQLPALKELILTNMPQEFVANVRQGLGRDILLTNTWEFSPLFTCKFSSSPIF